VWRKVLAVLVAFLAVATTTAASMTRNSSSGTLAEGLVDGTDLPGAWVAYDTGGRQPSRRDLCGHSTKRRTPQDTASTAWAITPDNGPIFGERLERYANAAQVKRFLDGLKKLKVPCNWANPDDGTHWRTKRLVPPRVGGTGEIFLVTSRDRTDSFNYQVTLASGDTLLRGVLNSRHADRALLDRLIKIAWKKAQKKGVVSR
jgi:hypothetical protein